MRCPGQGGQRKSLLKNIADCPIIFGQDCTFFLGVLKIFIIVSELVDSWVELETKTTFPGNANIA